MLHCPAAARVGLSAALYEQGGLPACQPAILVTMLPCLARCFEMSRPSSPTAANTLWTAPVRFVSQAGCMHRPYIGRQYNRAQQCARYLPLSCRNRKLQAPPRPSMHDWSATPQQHSDCQAQGQSTSCGCKGHCKRGTAAAGTTLSPRRSSARPRTISVRTVRLALSSQPIAAGTAPGSRSFPSL